MGCACGKGCARVCLSGGLGPSKRACSRTAADGGGVSLWPNPLRTHTHTHTHTRLVANHNQYVSLKTETANTATEEKKVTKEKRVNEPWFSKLLFFSSLTSLSLFLSCWCGLTQIMALPVRVMAWLVNALALSDWSVREGGSGDGWRAPHTPRTPEATVEVVVVER